MPELSDQSDCPRCGGYIGKDPALARMAQFPPGSAGWENAMCSYSGEPCDCPPEFDEERQDG